MTLYGVDTSSWQAGLDPASLQADFIITKATGGTGYINPACDKHFQAARNSGKLTGVYHFAHEAGFQGTAAQEAAFFLANVHGYLDGKTLLILDWESDNSNDVGWAKEWLDIVFKATGVRPLIYLNGSILRSNDWSSVINANYGMWYAEYAVTTTTHGYVAWDKVSGTWKAAADATCPSGPWGSTGPVMWQFADNALIDGYGAGVDANVFYGDRSTWLAYCTPVGHPVPAPAPAPAPVPHPAPAPAPAPPAPSPARPGGGPTVWIVDSGNTMSYIAGQVGVSLGALLAANPGVNANLIFPGQKLNLPAGAHWPGAAPAPAPAPVSRPLWWIVDPNDTMSGIAAAVGVSLADLEAANPGVNPNLIYPGQRLTLPGYAHWPS